MTVELLQGDRPAPSGGAGIKQLQEKAKGTAASGRKVVLAYVGAAAYVLDGVVTVYRSGERLLNSAEKRGQRMEQAVRRRFSNLEEQAVGEMRRLQAQSGTGVNRSDEVRDNVKEELERRIELQLASMGLPSRERLDRLGQEIDALNQKLDEQLLRLPSEAIFDQLG